jgi:hypothetical protein
MADKTFESATPDDAEGGRTELKREARRLNGIARNRDECFRLKLRQQLMGAERPRSWSLRILDWVFSERQKTDKARFCCDRCDSKRALAVADGDLAFLS